MARAIRPRPGTHPARVHCDHVGMGVACDYFAAASDDEAASVLESGPLAQGSVDTVELKGVEPVVAMGILESLLTQQPYEVVVENPRQGLQVADHDDGVFVMAMTSELQTALATAERVVLHQAASRWAENPELAVTDEEDLDALTEGLVELAALARRASARGEYLYCWMCL